MAKYIPIPDIHIGEEIRRWMHGKMTRQQLADKLHLPKSNIDRMLSSKSMETDKLLKICKLTGENFFARYGNHIDIANENIRVSHIGNEIWSWLDLNNISQNQLANALGVTHPVISKMIKKSSIDTDRLVQVSNILEHNFFTDILSKAPNPILHHEEYKIQNDGIWISKSALKRLSDHYWDLLHKEEDSHSEGFYWAGMADSVDGLLNLFERLENKQI